MFAVTSACSTTTSGWSPTCLSGPADIRIAAPDTRMSVLEIKYGLVPDMGITQSLPALLPMDVAKEIVWSGRSIEAEEALKLGLVTRIADSFAKYRWCPNIIGPQSGGSVFNLNLHQYEAMGEIQTKIPTEVLISDRREFELAELGFVPLSFYKNKDFACFFSAQSSQKPKKYLTAEAPADNMRLQRSLLLRNHRDERERPRSAEAVGEELAAISGVSDMFGHINSHKETR